MMIKRILFGLLLAVSAGSCFAQASLAIKGMDGKILGWFIGKVPGTTQIQFLTPQGHLITMKRDGVVENSLGATPDRVLFEAEECPEGCPYHPCAGRGWIEDPQNGLTNGSYEIQGEILQVGGQSGHVFVAVPWAPESRPWEFIAFVDEKGADGRCVPVTTTPENWMLSANEIIPADYGIGEIIEQIWGVLGPLTFEVQQPVVAFCNGFEACPNP